MRKRVRSVQVALLSLMTGGVLLSQVVAEDGGENASVGRPNLFGQMANSQSRTSPLDQWLDQTERRQEFDSNGDGQLDFQERSAARRAFVQENPPPLPKKGPPALLQRLGEQVRSSGTQSSQDDSGGGNYSQDGGNQNTQY